MSSSTAYVVGNGQIKKTTDGGNTWINLTSPSVQHNAVSFTDPDFGTIVSNSGRIYRTTNGGSTWTLQTSGTTATLLGVSFTDRNTGTAVGYFGTILRTTNGGTTWTPQTSGTSVILQDVSFHQWFSNHGTAVGGNPATILSTTDGGTTWVSQFEQSVNALTYVMSVSISSFDENIRFAVGTEDPPGDEPPRGLLLRTTNGGNTWDRQTAPVSENLIRRSFSGVSSIDDANATAVGLHGRIYKTTNGGWSWFEQSSSFVDVPSSISFLGISAPSPRVAYACGFSGSLAKTTDGGQSWVESVVDDSHPRLNGIHFTDELNGTAVGFVSYPGPDNRGYIARTTNGGLSWVFQISGVVTALNSVHFTDVNNGTAVGDLGRILRTTNGGTWVIQNSGTTARLMGVHFTDSSTGTVVGNNNTVLRTTDGGQNWFSRSPPGSTSFTGVSFLDANNGVIAGQGYVVKTTNGGEDWISLPHGLTANIYGVDYVDLNNIVAIGQHGFLIRSTDGGATWVNQRLTPNYLYGVSHFDVNSGFIVGENSTILGTPNSTHHSPRFTTEPANWCGKTVSIYINSAREVSIMAEDYAGGTGGIVTLSSSALPGNSMVVPSLPITGNPVTCTFQWQPSSDNLGYHSVRFTATNGIFSTDCDVDFVVYQEALLFFNGSPYDPNQEYSAYVNQTLDITVTATAEGEPARLYDGYWPSGAVVVPALPISGNPATTHFYWTPTSEDLHGPNGNRYSAFFEARTGFGGLSQALISLLVLESNCPQPKGYWKDNPDEWPVSAIPMMLGTLHTYDEEQLRAILRRAVHGDASIILANQLIAAKFNVASGAPVPSEAQDAIDEADNAIGELEIPAGVKSSSALGRTMTTLAATLEAYNNNVMTPTCGALDKLSVVKTAEQEPVTEFALFHNYPNPFNPETKIKWQSPVAGHQTLKVYDVLGNDVATLVDEYKDAGRYETTFDASRLASGIYFYRLRAGTFVETRKMLLVR